MATISLPTIGAVAGSTAGAGAAAGTAAGAGAAVGAGAAAATGAAATAGGLSTAATVASIAGAAASIGKTISDSLGGGPKIPELKAPSAGPDPEEVAAARRRALLAQQSRSGRASTVLSESAPRSSYSGTTLGG